MLCEHRIQAHLISALDSTDWTSAAQSKCLQMMRDMTASASADMTSDDIDDQIISRLQEEIYASYHSSGSVEEVDTDAKRNETGSLKDSQKDKRRSKEGDTGIPESVVTDATKLVHGILKDVVILTTAPEKG